MKFAHFTNSEEPKIGVLQAKASVFPQHGLVCCKVIFVPTLAEKSGARGAGGLCAQVSVCLHGCVCVEERSERVQDSLRYCRRLRKQDKNGAAAVGEAVEIEGTNTFGARSTNVTLNLVVLEDTSIGGKTELECFVLQAPLLVPVWFKVGVFVGQSYFS